MPERTIRLIATGSGEPGMVLVDGGQFSIGVVTPVELSDYWIDMFEVTNREFKRFVDAGGYGDQKYWKEPLLDNGRTLAFEDGVLELRSGRGWLRTRELYLDFQVQFEFRATTPEIDAGLMVRTWPGRSAWPDRSLRVLLPTSSQDGSSLLVGRKEKVTVVQEGRVDLRPPDEWQRVRVTGEGRRLTVSVNDTVAGVFEVETFGGYILFDNRRGRVQLRNITIQPSAANLVVPDGLITFKELEEAGGTPPKVLHEVKPLYTHEAMQRDAEGRVDMEAVVLPDGSVGGVRITRSLDPDLDVSAVAAVKAWKFQPGVLNGKPVPVLVDVEMTFTVK